jgi:hypothetical protein
MNETMKHFACNSMRLLAGACGLFALLAVTPAAVAQQTASAPASTPSQTSPAAQTGSSAPQTAKPSAEEETAAPNSGNHQGIKVHGHWVLQVKNADGTLGERREFENSLVTGSNLESVSGNQVLALLLSGNATAGDPGIAFIPSGTNIGDPTIPCSNLGSTSSCYGFTTGKSPLVNPGNFVNSEAKKLAGGGYNPLESSQTGLGITVNVSPNIYWTLSGNYTVPSGLSSIAYVETILPVCMAGSNFTIYDNNDPQVNQTQSEQDRGSTVAPAACDNTVTDVVYGTLTATTVTSGGVATPLTVSSGQIIAITVIITFS